MVLGIMAGLTQNFSTTKHFKATFPVFRCVAVIIIHLWCWGAVVWAYSATRVNYGTLYPMPHHHILKMVVVRHLTITIVWLGVD
jgi:hypothetical protein